MATKDSKEVAPRPQAGLPAGYDLEELQKDAADHNPQMEVADVALPFIVILQKLSPQLEPSSPKYIEGAKPGMFHNNVSDEVFPAVEANGEAGVLFVPCFYERRFVEWEPRETGGGYITDYDTTSDIMSKAKPNDKKRMVLPNGHLIVETAYHYGLMLNPETGVWEQACVALASTGLKHNRKWNNEIVTTKIPGTEIQAPRWLFPYQLKTFLDQKANNTFYSWVIEKMDEPVTPDVYKMAKEFNLLVGSGTLKRAAPPSEAAAGESTSAASDNIPF